jgi:hypothetical protein
VGTAEGPGVVVDTKILVQLALVRLEGTEGREIAVPIEELMDPDACPPPGSLLRGEEPDGLRGMPAQRLESRLRRGERASRDKDRQRERERREPREAAGGPAREAPREPAREAAGPEGAEGAEGAPRRKRRRRRRSKEDQQGAYRARAQALDGEPAAPGADDAAPHGPATGPEPGEGEPPAGPGRRRKRRRRRGGRGPREGGAG